MKFINRFNLALQMGLPKEIFDHIRNYLICATVLLLGMLEVKHAPGSALFGLVPIRHAGFAVVGLAFALMALNCYDGIRKLSRHRYHVAFTICLIAAYLFFSVRLIEMAWNYRLG